MPNQIRSTTLASALLLGTLALASSACGSTTDAPAGTDDTGVMPGFENTYPPPPQSLAEAPLPGSPSPDAHGPGTFGAKGGAATGTSDDTGAPDKTFSSKERIVAAKLGLPSRFAIGLGNDADGTGPSGALAWGLAPKVDIHYAYLSNLDWPEWNLPAGNYITLQANAAAARGVVPMFSLYQAAAWGENNLTAFNDTAFMTKYWRGVRIMFEKLGAFGDAAIVHVEPDLWGYTQQKGDSPSVVPMKVGSIVPQCSDLPANVGGMSRCVIRLARSLAPNVVIGLSASSFGKFTNGASDPTQIGAYMNAIGANEADILVVETLDRDAGCFETAVDPKCQRAGTFYWDENNVAHPNFHDHLAWAKTLRGIVGLPLLWWQMPLGRPSSAAGSAGAYRDNRVKYLFAHADEFAAAGGIGAVFGQGATNQTTVKTDGGQFANGLTSYLASPAALP